ncbi:ATP-binding cassette domain-containing protein [Alkalibaculum sp. M08DMB]|uniref:ATP-binding cassette domain-containing protein n=1 Tax=Alkalibaculum sporogenes TaxID=2655001 RepID=A0A6A7KD16_9FIRM|nr:ABC transporter ATP-binding protein [Alkalibaculum sporogenes]MPW27235.1 ATP-binding cassette domain-containing protein [Alkalibaculum sporogenes]
MEIIEIQNMSFTYPNTESKALIEINLSIRESEFLVICGQSGCGKTTLLRNLKKEIAPHGQQIGNILYKGVPIKKIDEKVSATEIGFVLQDPENQIVTDTVWHELAFGLENIGVPTPTIRRRIAETAHFFGINEWFEKSVFELSGGQKQLLNLASIMAMQPEVIIFDEPTAQLDPVAAKDFLTVLRRINLELGTTVIISEHRLEELFPISDRVLYMKDGQIDFSGDSKAFSAYITAIDFHTFRKALPSAVQISCGLKDKERYPISVREGRLWLQEYVQKNDCICQSTNGGSKLLRDKEKPVLRAKDLWYKYDQDPYVLKGLTLDIYPGEIHAILGSNGSGKTTALNVLAGILSPIKGTVKLKDKNISKIKDEVLYKNNIAVLNQNPKTMFVYDTVYEDLQESIKLLQLDKEHERIMEISDALGITHLLKNHPYDLSGGEQQKAAIAKLLLLNPEVLLLDEPTKGIDVYAKEELAKILIDRASEGRGVVMVTHDVEFVAMYCDICSMVFNGDIICTELAKDFFVGNNFYTTSANRISRGIIDNVVTCKDVISKCL